MTEKAFKEGVNASWLNRVEWRSQAPPGRSRQPSEW